MTHPLPPSWHPLQPEAWLQSRQGGLTVLHNLQSADTHLLNDLSLEILRLLENAPATLEELLVQMGVGAGNEEERVALARVLWELDHLGLITPAPGNDAS